jgi:hypothetical protein
MKEKRFLHIIGDIDERHIEEAAPKAKKRFAPAWTKWIAAAACLCLVIGAVLIVPNLRHKQPIKPSEEIPLSSKTENSPPETFPVSDKTTAIVRYATDEEVREALNSGGTTDSLMCFSEEEMFSRDDMYIFRGVVTDLTNITIDFEQRKEFRCIATIDVQKIYSGDIPTDKPLKVLLPYIIYQDSPIHMNMVEAGVIDQIRVGMEGIFMPSVYDNDSIMEIRGETLLLTDLAPCGIGDSIRWAFIETGQGLLFSDFAYPGAASAKTLDDIEEYVLKMLSDSH